jgi:hypothetical protein
MTWRCTPGDPPCRRTGLEQLSRSKLSEPPAQKSLISTLIRCALDGQAGTGITASRRCAAAR